MNPTTIRSRVRGAILGTAIGDALGMPAEGLKPETIRRIYGRIRSFIAPRRGSWAAKSHPLSRGQWTDDTQLMLAIGESVAELRRLDYEDIARRHILTMKEPRGWGGSTIAGITKIKAGVSWWNSAKPDGAGNGTPMKIAPIGALLALGRLSDFEAVTAVINISRMTHGDPRPAVAGIIQARAVAAAIRGGWEGLSLYLMMAAAVEAPALESVLGRGSDGPQISDQLRAAIGSWSPVSYDEVREKVGAGCFVAQSYPFTLGGVWRFGADPENCLVEIVNQGGDADTTGAMAGALMGAAHGLSAFPTRWRRPLEGYSRLLSLADALSSLPPLEERPRIWSDRSFSRPRIAYSKGGK